MKLRTAILYSKYIKFVKKNKNFIFKLIVYFELFMTLLTLFYFPLTSPDKDVSNYFILMISVIVIYLFILITSHLFHYFLGYHLEYIFEHHYSNLIITEELGGIIHTTTLPGGGKDTLAANGAIQYEQKFKCEMMSKLKELEIFLYYFNLKELIEYTNSSSIFIVASETYRFENFINFILDNEHICIKKYYQIKMCINDLIEDRKIFLDDYLSAKYIVTDTIKYQHLLDVLYQYVYYSYRLFLDRFIMSNQPMKNGNNDGVMIYSDKFKWFKLHHEPIKNPDNKSDQNLYVPKIKFLAEDYTVAVLTEQDILKGNYQSKVLKSVNKTGEKPWYAARRHFQPNYVEFSNGQIEGRSAKIIRENYTWNVKILRKPIILEIHKIKRKFLKRITKLCNILIKLNRTDIVRSKLYTLRVNIYVLYSKLYFDGYILQEVACRPFGYHGECVIVDKVDIISRDKTLLIEGFKCSLVSLIRDTWTKYNSYYLNELAEEVKKKSSVSIANVDTWDTTLKLTVEKALQLDSEIIDEYLNISFDDVKDLRYEVIKKEKNKKKDSSLFNPIK